MRKQKGMKKAAAFFLSLTLICSMSGLAYATEADTDTGSSGETAVEELSEDLTIFAAETDMSVLSGTVVLDETVTYTDGVTIADDAEVSAAADGYTVVMTVDGVQQDIEAGTYEGEVVLSVVKLVEDTYVSHGSATVQTMTVALSIKTDDEGNNYIDYEESATAALVGGTYDAYSAENITITSNGDYFGGIRVGGDAEYTIENLTIVLNGNGGNDFTGIGAAIAAVDNANVTVKNVNIVTTGALRSVAFAGDTATLTVQDSYLETHSLWAEENVLLEEVSIATAGMTVPPAGLGVYGNNRSTNVVDSANVSYVDCTISSDSWGAMGSDDIDATEDDPLYMNLVRCSITVANSGYGAYSIGYIWDVLDDTDITVENGMGVIVAAEGSAKLTNGSTITSGRFGIVTHQGMGAVSNIVVEDNSSITAEYTGILIKERATNITISDGATITANSGAMIQAIVNDDTGAGSLQGTETITITISDTDLEGDILQSLADVPMTITMTNASVKGAISTATPTMLNGGVIGSEVEDRYTVGIISGNTLEALDGTDLILVMEEGAVWTVTETSYLTSLTLSDGAVINGIVYVDGTETAVEAGTTYEGNIVVMADDSQALDDTQGGDDTDETPSTDDGSTSDDGDKSDDGGKTDDGDTSDDGGKTDDGDTSDNDADAAIDTSDLEAAIETAESLTESDYTSDSWSVLEEALAAALEVLDAPESQDAVDEAAQTLYAAIVDLEAASDEDTDTADDADSTSSDDDADSSSSTTSSAKTGDTSELYVWMLVLAAAAAAVGVNVYRKKKVK